MTALFQYSLFDPSFLEKPPDSQSLWTGKSTVTGSRSEEHTSELQSLAYLVCRLLLEKKNNMRLLLSLPRTVPSARRAVNPAHRPLVRRPRVSLALHRTADAEHPFSRCPYLPTLRRRC